MIGSPGFLADAVTLQKHLHARHVMYQHNHGRPMSCPAMAQVRARASGPRLRATGAQGDTIPRGTQLLSNTLYYKRFFPYYAFNICAGLDTEGAPLPHAAVARARRSS